MAESIETILLTGVDFESFNRGVVALSYGALNCLLESNKKRKIALWKIRNRKPFFKIQKIETNGEVFEIPSYTTNQFQTLILLALSFLVKSSSGSLKEFLLNKNHFFKTLKSFGVVIDLSEGDSFTDLYGFKRMFAFSALKIIPMNLGLPIFIFPQTIGPFRLFLSRLLAKWTLNKAKKIYAREPFSEKIVSEILKEKQKLNPSIDLGFLLTAKPIDYEPLLQKGKGLIRVGINVSGLIYDENERKKILRKEFDYPQLIIALIKELTVRYPNLIIFLVPHVYTSKKGEKQIKEDDLKASQEIFNQLSSKEKERVFILEKDYSCFELKGFIGRLDFFVGTRMHACLSALSNGVPTALLAYSYKSTGLMERFGLRELAFDMSLIEATEIREGILRAFEKRREIKEQLVEINPILRKNLLEICRLF